MPRASGLAVLSEAHELFPELPTMLMTGHPAVRDASEAIHRGASEYLVKPLDREDLVRRVARAVNRYRASAPAQNTVFAISAFPGDAEHGAGGTLLAHRAAGHDVIVATVAWTLRSGSALRPHAEKSAQMLAAQLIAANMREGAFERARILDFLLAAVQRFEPDVVYLPSATDAHPDRVTTHEAALAACRTAQRVYCYQTPTSSLSFRPNRFVPIDPDGKVGLLGPYAGLDPAFSPEVARSTAVYWGRFGGHGPIEAFEVVHDSEAAPDLDRSLRAS